jgi:hypothetical protein
VLLRLLQLQAATPSREDAMSTKTITIEPNYGNLFNQFLRDAMLHLNGMSRPHQPMLERRGVYDFIASFRIALGSATTVAQIVELRKQFDEAAEKMFAAVTHDQLETDGDHDIDDGV